MSASANRSWRGGARRFPQELTTSRVNPSRFGTDRSQSRSQEAHWRFRTSVTLAHITDTPSSPVSAPKTAHTAAPQRLQKLHQIRSCSPRERAQSPTTGRAPESQGISAAIFRRYVDDRRRLPTTKKNAGGCPRQP